MTQPEPGGQLAQMLAGFAGGLAGSWAMSECQALWSRAAEGREPQSAGGRHDARDWQERSEGQNANEILPQKLARRTIGRPLSHEELAVAAPLSHYLFGASMGALYAAFRHDGNRPDPLKGAAFGVALWAAADEVAVPLLNLSDSPGRRPFEMHAQAFAAHIVYGIAVEAVRWSLTSSLSLRR